MFPNNPAPGKAGYRRLIVCDLDGTLLNSQKLISPANLAAIRAAREEGHFVTVCTGRIPEMMEAYIRLLEIEGLFIAANGAVIAGAQGGAMPFCSYADVEESRRLLEYCAGRGLEHIVCATGGCYYSKGSRRIERFEQYNEIAAKDNLRQISLVPFGADYGNVRGMRIYKMLVSELAPDEQRETEEFIAGLGKLGYTSSEPHLLDINAAGADKGTGIENLARLMGFTKEQICVFGDYRNDIPMFEAAGFSAAMGNADEEVKRRATIVTGTNDEDGVAMAIKKYLL
ncbi:MAG: Cof-type HAD-IIB family hydrolase [Treponemataceae bacterium]|nr:MAG: Cof-type HAD-IIB family hydrolase [Treponemataceae bacterium]